MHKLFDSNFPFRPQKFPFFYGWVILFASSIGIVTSIPGQTMGFSVFTPILSESLHLSSSSISGAYLLGTIVAGFMLPPIGKLFDKLGARILGTFVCLIMGLGLLYLSQVDRLSNTLSGTMVFLPASLIAFTLITLGFFWLRLTGQGALTMTSRSMLGKWFDHKRGLALSISGMVVGFSFSLAPKVLDASIQAIGWRWTWAGLGILISSPMLLFVWFFFRDNPEECDLQMDGTNKNRKKSKNKDLIIHKEFTRKEALQTYSFWVFNLLFAIHSFSITGYTFHIVSIAEEIGQSKDAILQAFIPASIIGILISLIGGIINPYIRLKYLLSILSIGGILFSYGISAEAHNSTIYIIIGLGLCNGIFGLASGLVWPRFFGRKHLGAISGVGMSTLVYASAIAPLAFSLSNDILGLYKPVFHTIMAAYSLFFVASFFADNPQRKMKLNETL